MQGRPKVVKMSPKWTPEMTKMDPRSDQNGPQKRLKWSPQVQGHHITSHHHQVPRFATAFAGLHLPQYPKHHITSHHHEIVKMINFKKNCRWCVCLCACFCVVLLLLLIAPLLLLLLLLLVMMRMMLMLRPRGGGVRSSAARWIIL